MPAAADLWLKDPVYRGLLDDVIENPDDDTPRLVMTDWLEEHGDPIAHELIVGPPDVHARHAEGTEAEHPSIPGEVSVGAGLTAVTTFTFDEPGTFEFACHLPGHYAYGMHGEVEVVPA